jgi:hypothetical protein
MLKRAQGTIEYLLIIAIVVVIGLVVVGLMTGFLDSGSEVNEKQSRIFWSSQPLAIIDAIVDADGNGIFIIQNNEFEDKNVMAIIIDGVSHEIESGAGTKLASGGKYAAYPTGLSACNSTSKAYNIRLSHISQEGIDKNSDAHDYIVFCTTQITGSGSSTPGSGLEYTGSPATGAFVIYDGAAWGVSRDTNTPTSGITIDGNTMCFNGCDANIDWNGTDIIISTD